MAELHLLRPLWLLLLPVGAWLIWLHFRGRADGGGWRSVVEASLRPHVLAEPEVLRDSRFPLLAALAVWALAIVALSGPTWERLPVPAFRSDEALVVALDLSRSMNAGDVEPSRLARAKLKLLDLLERRAAGQTALVVFSAHAFTVTPLTTDTRTISSLVGAVDTDIMPTQGGSPAAGLERAAALLEQTGLSRGDILLITDSEVSERDLDVAGELASGGYRISVLAVGTEQGAPIPRADGGFVTDDEGQVVVPQLDAAGLQRLAATGGGRYAELAATDRDLDALFPPSALPLDAFDSARADGGEEYEADAWLDRGIVLAVLLLPLLALTFRRGWIAVWLLVMLAPLPRAHAFEWQDLWQRRDQRGVEALEAQDPARAAELFETPEWRSAAQYRAEQFDASAASLANVDSALAHYNRGNALAKAGQIPAAIGAYDRALELDPNHEDARYNRDLLQQFLEDNPPPQQDPSEGQQNPQGDSGADQSQGGEQQDGEASNEQQGEQGEQGESGQDQSADGSSDEPNGEPQEDEQNANAGEQAAEESVADTAGPEEVEQWASEQAAEQWLRRVPQDPGGLLRRKFLYQYQRMGVDQNGNRVGTAAEQRPW